MNTFRYNGWNCFCKPLHHLTIHPNVLCKIPMILFTKWSLVLEWLFSVVGGFLVWLVRRNERKALSVVVLFLSTTHMDKSSRSLPHLISKFKNNRPFIRGQRYYHSSKTPKVELSQKPRVDSGGVHYFETANCLLTIVRVIFIFFHHLLLTRIILWHCDSLHLCAFQELFLLQNAETGSLHVSRNVAKNRKCCQNKKL